MQHRRDGHAGIIRERLPQRQRSVCSELGNEPFGQRLDAVVLLAFALWLRIAIAADCNDCTLDRSGRSGGRRSIAAITIDLLGRRLVLGSDIAALDPEITLAVDA